MNMLCFDFETYSYRYPTDLDDVILIGDKDFSKIDIDCIINPPDPKYLVLHLPNGESAIATIYEDDNFPKGYYWVVMTSEVENPKLYKIFIQGLRLISRMSRVKYFEQYAYPPRLDVAFFAFYSPDSEYIDIFIAPPHEPKLRKILERYE